MSSEPLEVQQRAAPAKSPRKRKRKAHKRAAVKAVTPLVREKPKLPNLDPRDAELWQQTARNAQEGNVKLARACDILREGLQTLVTAEMDYSTKPPTFVQAPQLRAIATETLEAYSRHTGQDWRSQRNQVVRSRAGGLGNNRNTGNDGDDYDG
jgi:hypothetical protein